MQKKINIETRKIGSQRRRIRTEEHIGVGRSRARNLGSVREKKKEGLQESPFTVGK
jgi:hypothetical protein